jgi:hypothetical protein
MGFSLIKYLIVGVVIALVLAIHPGNAQASPLDIEDCIKALPPGYTEPLFSGLGNHKYPTLTEELKSKKAKDYFNQGMTLLYAFNHRKRFIPLIRLQSTSQRQQCLTGELQWRRVRILTQIPHMLA